MIALSSDRLLALPGFKQHYKGSMGADASYTADYEIMMATLASNWGAVVGSSLPTPPGAVAVGFTVGQQVGFPLLFCDFNRKMQVLPPFSCILIKK